MTKNDWERWKSYTEVKQLWLEVYDQMIRTEEYALRHSQFNDITPKELHVIHVIGLHGDKRSTDVARRLSVSKGTLTAKLNSLERKGYVERVHDKNDRRVTFLTLTNKGRLLYRAHNAIHKKIMTPYLRGLDDDNIANIKNALIDVEKVIKEVRE